MNRGKIVLRLLAAFLLLSQLVYADSLRVSRSATIKDAPHRGAEVLLRASEGDVLELASSTQTNGYYEVWLPRHTRTGWIYRTLVRRSAGIPPAPDHEPVLTPSTSGKLEIHVIDIGQGDASLIRCPEGTHELLIDSGELNSRYPDSGDDFKEYLVRHQAIDNPIEVVVATHPHSDHIGNMDWVLQEYRVDLYVDNENVRASDIYKRVDKAFTEAQTNFGTEYWGAQETSVPDIDFCSRDDVTAIILRVDKFGQDRDPNNNSVIVRVDHGDDCFLFVGDAEEEAELALVADSDTKPLLDCNFLKVGHHGSATSSTKSFLDQVTPEISVISCGKKGVGTNSKYKHPRAERVNALLAHAGDRPEPPTTVQAFNSDTRKWESTSLDKAVYVTAVEGDLVFVSDGQGIRRK